MPADWARVVMISPVEKTLDMKNVLGVARQWNDRVVELEVHQADWTL